MSDEELRQTYQKIIERRSGRSSCPPAERLHELVTRSGPEDARLVVANHVMACLYCLPEFELLRSMDQAMPERKPATRWLAIAASVALLVAAGIVGRQMLQPRGDVLRENPVVRLLSPDDGDRVGLPLQLTWGRVGDAVQYQVQILTPEGASAYTATTADTSLAIDSLPTGSDFIWQVAAEYSTGEPTRSRPARFTLTKP